jgi:hypothetical protein
VAEDLMHYDILAQEALRGVVRAALEVARDQGLPGEHHFYISFHTNHPGVQISERLHQQYPEEMTIVLQHQFFNLQVRDDGFSVELSFNKIPETLVVPYAAIQGFFDPSVQFGLQFKVDKSEHRAAPIPAATAAPADPHATPTPSVPGEVVSLDAFRKK